MYATLRIRRITSVILEEEEDFDESENEDCSEREVGLKARQDKIGMFNVFVVLSK